jgi:uncharacterized protein
MGIRNQIASLLGTKAGNTYSGPFARSLEILVLQPTPFCNINCDYCYLPHRSQTHRMGLDTIRAAVRTVVDGGLVDHCLSVVWHAGEPLVLPISYYQEAFAAIDEAVQGRFQVSHSFQTNGTLIDRPWCEFFQKHPVRIGLSIDGPAFLHDLHRKTRAGKGTHAQAMEGAECLREHGITFHVIAVISADSLDHAEAIFHFFEEQKIREVGFNVEELEGDHGSSSLSGEAALNRIEKFWQRLYELQQESEGAVDIREFRKAAQAILGSRTDAPWQEIAQHNDQVMPFRIISVDWQGNLSTFSPELLGVRDAAYNDFTFGQAGHTDLATIRASASFQQLANGIWKGVEACARTCDYFVACGGGAPSNKYFENKSLASTETMYCRTSIQMPFKIVLAEWEHQLRIHAEHIAKTGVPE